MNQLRSTPGGSPLENDRLVPIDDPAEPMTENTLRRLELDRAADEGMTEPSGPEMDVPGIEPSGPGMEVPGTEVPGPMDEPRSPGVEVPGTKVPGPTDEPADPAIEAPGRDDRPPIVTAGSLAVELIWPA